MGQDTKPKERIVSIDAIRGLVIMLMAIDHSRDFFGDLRINCEDPEIGWSFFLTRWITHFCAPTFVFLAGISAWIYGSRSESKSVLSKFLLTRGIWLIVLEFTIIRFSLAFSLTQLPWLFLVIAAIGTSMVVLSALCFFDTYIVLITGVLICCFHNILDPIESIYLGGFSFFWTLLHDGGPIQGTGIIVGYPVLPWIGVMCVGYGLGPVFSWNSKRRKYVLFAAGLLITIAFLLVRFPNGYGNPQPWTTYPLPTAATAEVNEPQSDVDAPAVSEDDSAAGSVQEKDLELSATARSFMNTRKYPPSLAFILMTLGPAMIMLGVFEFFSGSLVTKFLLVFGKVPLFFYVLHFYLLSAGSVLAYLLIKGVPLFVFREVFQVSQGSELPAEFGFEGLIPTYVAWLLVITVLFPLCLLYGRFKRKTRHWIWSYL